MFLGEFLVVSVTETPKLFVLGGMIEIWPSGVLPRPPYVNKGSKSTVCFVYRWPILRTDGTVDGWPSCTKLANSRRLL